MLKNMTTSFKFSTLISKFKDKQKFGFISKTDGDGDGQSVLHDYIGPPDKVSNIRPILRATYPKMDSVEMCLHRRQIEIEKWNNDFWTTHNNRFYNEKVEFISKNGDDNISADKLSEFYKSFLERNQKLHFFYNVSWYMKNFELLVLDAQVKMRRLFNRNKT